MTRIFVRDYETSGVPIFSAVPSEDPRQPHIIEAGLALYDLESRERLMAWHGFVRPDGLEAMPPEAYGLHGITLEQAMTGIPRRLFVRILHSFSAAADYRVAHPKSFEDRMERITIKRCHADNPGDGLDAYADEYKARDSRCTQSRSTPLVNAQRKADGGKAKTASLQEAYEFIVGRPMPTPHHRAWSDMLNTADLWFALEDLQNGAMPPPDETGIGRSYGDHGKARPAAATAAPVDRPATLAERFGAKPRSILDVDLED